MPEEEAVILFENVTKKFDGQVVLDRLSFSVKRGENVAVLGMSGSGKTVLLKLIVGLLELDEGEIHLWGHRLSKIAEEELNALRRRMGIVFQSGALFDSMTVYENVAFPLEEAARLARRQGRKAPAPDAIEATVRERLEWVGLGEAGDKYPSELSGGMRKRAALARTFAYNPELVLYDEPTAGLDPVSGRRISCLIRDLDTRLGSTSITVTHDLDCARTVADRWAFLARGRILADGPPDALLESPHDEIREFLAPDLPSFDRSFQGGPQP